MAPPLHIVTPIFNPRRYKRRYELFNFFKKHVEDSGAILYVVELALGDRPFVVTEADNPRHFRYRSRDEYFVKENLINLAFRRLPVDADRIGYLDADIMFANPNWVEEVSLSLNHHPVVQPFGTVVNLDPDWEPFQMWVSLAKSFSEGRPYVPIGSGEYPSPYFHPGFGLFFTRDALDHTGGLLDRIPLGSADSHMLASLIGKARHTVHGSASTAFKQYVYNWEDNIQRWFATKGYTLGYTPGLICHAWHGRMKTRFYKERWKILIDNDFNPYLDLVPEVDGLLRLSDRNPKLRAEIQSYLSSRKEDCVYFDPSERTIFRGVR